MLIREPQNPMPALMAIPSVAQTVPEPGVSDRYQYVSTIEIVERAMEQGFYPVNVIAPHRQAEFGRHVVTLVKDNMIETYRDAAITRKVSGGHEAVPNIVVVNSHNRSAAVQFTAGLFRLVCANGLMVNGEYAQKTRILHLQGHAMEIPERIAAVANNLGGAMGRMQQMMARPMTADEQFQFAVEAMVARHGSDRFLNTSGQPIMPVDPLRLLHHRRNCDNLRNTQDLWTTFNVVQENLMKGGYYLQGRFEANEDGSLGRYICASRARGVSSPSVTVELNEKLWSLADKYTEN